MGQDVLVHAVSELEEIRLSDSPQVDLLVLQDNPVDCGERSLLTRSLSANRLRRVSGQDVSVHAVSDLEEIRP